MERIIYKSKDTEYKSLFGALPTNKKCTFNIDILAEETPRSAVICVREDAKDDFVSYPMENVGFVGDYVRFSCEISFEKEGLYFYRFEFTCPEGTRFCGVRDGNAYVEDWLDEWQLTVYDEHYDTPHWAKNKVMYQIFPDRFCRSNNYMYEPAVNARFIQEDWYGTPQNQGTDFFMGNIEGIIEKLPYIKEMGTDIIYLNPIFESPENHRYSTGNYLNIDPYLGKNEDFERLCIQAEKVGIKIVLDGVFSHTGADSLYFNKFGHYDSTGAWQGENSPYYRWYNFHGEHYDCWWGFENLPNVNETHPDYLEFITGEAGVLSFWQNRGAAGWRLDVADELPDEFLDALRYRVKETDHDALIIGEVWEDATNKFAYGIRRRYLLGKQLDSVMNYPWRTAIIDYIRSGNAQGFADAILSIEENYPKPSIDCLMNIISTHDTERIINATGVLRNIDRDEARNYVLSDEEWSRGIAGAKAAMFLLFSLPGIACVYYGDEVGLEGFRDPYCRKGYPYGRENFDIYNMVKNLAALRKEHKDAFSSLIEKFSVFGSAMCYERGDLMFVINMGENDENIKITGEFVTIFGQNLTDYVNGMLTIPRKSYSILVRKNR